MRLPTCWLIGITVTASFSCLSELLDEMLNLLRWLTPSECVSLPEPNLLTSTAGLLLPEAEPQKKEFLSLATF
jgi:hypothetical protein